ncbi:MAG: DUF4870 domain-containing protein [Chitinophagaceae bacterium]|jgi:uncharacterized protein|nr:DUF4870 domain-containing protein [Chitinophagaceae bacterium]
MQQNFANAQEVKYAQVSSDERTMAILCHVLSIFFSFIPALVIYLVKKDESPYVAEHAKEVLNFQISLFIYAMISVVLIFLIIGILLLIVLSIVALILYIIAAIKASDDILYRYPLTIRLIK